MRGEVVVRAVEAVPVDAGAVDDPARSIVGQAQVDADGLLDVMR